ncbi:Microsomal glutathione S-transferase 3 [Tetrabaena socialis]|uniref:Glutathione S-transferase 3, mitochondrial n=1 Tax=Tetrabaena socialis TaxID=47790 RepID=A0A2J8AK15_9CHLO|nr:Microsomal glutathione S-transferase 3 [Tetrabaena socialis]|eukprot:PNH12866.1 Microsomal glutathione S-transferase 3 [Tetrabaena socialis]
MQLAVARPPVLSRPCRGPQRKANVARSSAIAAPMSLVLPANFGWIAGVVVGSYAVHHGFMAFHVMKARKRFGVSYPTLYATAEECPSAESRKAFNCVQRGHQNSLENQPIFLALLLTAGLKHPLTAAAAGALYLIGRVMYMQGYATGDPNARMRGSIMYVGLLTLLGVVGKWAVQTAVAAIAK